MPNGDQCEWCYREPNSKFNKQNKSDQPRTQDGRSQAFSRAVGSALYHRVMGYDSTDDLTHKVWDGTPWMVEAYTDSINSQRWQNVMEWCREYCGPEAWPIHGKAGKWHSGGVTVNGETWMAFADEQMMNDFNAKWQNCGDET